MKHNRPLLDHVAELGAHLREAMRLIDSLPSAAEPTDELDPDDVVYHLGRAFEVLATLTYELRRLPKR